MTLFEKPPLDSIPPVRERWTPLFLEHGRVEVDDSSVKWIGADRTVMRLPVSSLSVLLLGPGTTVTHAAVRACAECNTSICWVGADGMHFYATGITTTHDNERARLQAELAASSRIRDSVARRMFSMRFKDVDVSKYSVKELRGFEGRRVKQLYSQMGLRFGVSWKGRNYDTSNWSLADNINRAISAANAALYALTASVITSMGYLPQLGFIHTAGTIPFVFDMADIYKPETTLPAAFETVSLMEKTIEVEELEEYVITRLKYYIEISNMLKRLPEDLSQLIRKE